jgi:predicted RNA binding protein YcfA (HicA-like mRNA interferase family)
MRYALVISAGTQFPLVSAFLDEMNQANNGCRKLLVPPESHISNVARARQLQASELEAARLRGEQNDATWNAYKRSKGDSEQVVNWLSVLRSSEVHRSILKDLHELAFRRSTKWLKQIRDNPQRDPKVFAHARDIVEPLLTSIARGERLARRTRCKDFITKKLVADAAVKIVAEHEPERPEDSVAGWAAAKARRVYAALLRIGWSLKRQEGSHRTLQRLGWRDFVFTFHESVEIGPPVLAEIGRSTGLRPDDL